MKKQDRWRARALAKKSLIPAADLRAALGAAFPQISVQAGPAALEEAATELDAAARIVLTRLASAGTTDLDQIEADLDTIRRSAEAILVALEAKQELAGGEMLVQRAKAAAPPTLLTSILEGAAQAAGFERPDEVLDEALTLVANLLQWTGAAQASFKAGRFAPRQRQLNAIELREKFGVVPASIAGIERLDKANLAGLSDLLPVTHAHTSVDLGLAVIAAYTFLTGRPVAISRTSTTKKSLGGEVSGPLSRFVIEVFAGIRTQLALEPSLIRYGTAPAFNPTGATVAGWVKKYQKAGLRS